MKQFLLLAAVICFGVAVLKFAGRRSRSGARRAQALRQPGTLAHRECR